MEENVSGCFFSEHSVYRSLITVNDCKQSSTVHITNVTQTEYK